MTMKLVKFTLTLMFFTLNAMSTKAEELESYYVGCNSCSSPYTTAVLSKKEGIVHIIDYDEQNIYSYQVSKTFEQEIRKYVYDASAVETPELLLEALSEYKELKENIEASISMDKTTLPDDIAVSVWDIVRNQRVIDEAGNWAIENGGMASQIWLWHSFARQLFPSLFTIKPIDLSFRTIDGSEVLLRITGMFIDSTTNEIRFLGEVAPESRDGNRNQVVIFIKDIVDGSSSPGNHLFYNDTIESRMSLDQFLEWAYTNGIPIERGGNTHPVYQTRCIVKDNKVICSIVYPGRIPGGKF